MSGITLNGASKMKPTFTYKGVEISYYSASDFWGGCPHWAGTGDPDDFNARGKTLRDVMDAIDEHLAETDEQENTFNQLDPREDCLEQITDKG
jgi:hypothetical protein